MKDNTMPATLLNVSFEELESRVAARYADPSVSRDTNRKLLEQLDLSEFNHLVDEGCPGPVDIHKLRAAQVFGVDPDFVTDEQRQAGKQLNQMRLYSCGKSTFAQAFNSQNRKKK